MNPSRSSSKSSAKKVFSGRFAVPADEADEVDAGGGGGGGGGGVEVNPGRNCSSSYRRKKRMINRSNYKV